MENKTKIVLLGVLICSILIFVQLQSVYRSFSNLETAVGLESNKSSANITEKTIQPDPALLKKAESINKIWKYALLLPQNYTVGKKYPLIIGLHGAGGSAADYARMWETEADKYGFIVACPQSNDSEGWWPLTANYMIIAVIDDVNKSYNISDIFLTGHSAGAKITYSTALWNPHVFKGIAPVSSSFGTFIPQQDDLENAKGQNFYIVHGENDNVIPLVNAMNARNILEAAGANVAFIVLPNHGHEYPLEENENIIKWFMSLQSNATIGGSNYSNSSNLIGYEIKNGTITQITNSDYSNVLPQINNGKIVWAGGRGLEYEIFLYDTQAKTTSQITHNNYHDYAPKIDAGGVVWEGGTYNYDIFLYDIQTNTTTQLTNNNYANENPQIKDGKVVWSSGGEIFFYDIPTRTTTKITNDNYDNSYPITSDGKIVWQRYDGHYFEIFLYDTLTKKTTQLGDNSYDNYASQIKDGKVVWQSRNKDSAFDDIFLYDIQTKTTTKITNSTYPAGNARIDDGKVVWQSRNKDSAFDDIFLYDIQTNTTTQLTNNNYPDENPQIKDGQVVWQEGSSDSSEILLYDIPTNKIYRITNNTYLNSDPQIDDGKIVWQGGGKIIQLGISLSNASTDKGKIVLAGGVEDFPEIFLWESKN
jgi:Tol biopolymer transport system component